MFTWRISTRCFFVYCLIFKYFLLYYVKIIEKDIENENIVQLDRSCRFEELL